MIKLYAYIQDMGDWSPICRVAKRMGAYRIGGRR